MNRMLQCSCSTNNSNIISKNILNSVISFDIRGLVGVSFKDYLAVRMSYCALPNVFNTFTKQNNKLDIQVEGQGRVVIEMDEGLYDTAESLVSVLELSLQNAFPDNNFVAFLDPILGKMIISSTSEFAISSENTTCNAILGLSLQKNDYPIYSEPYPDSPFYLIASSSICSLQSIKRVDIFIEELRTRSFIESKSVGIIASITVDSAPDFGFIQYTNPSDQYVGFSELKNIETLTFVFRDQNGDLIDFTNSDWKIIIDIQFLPRDDNDQIGFYDFIDKAPLG